MKKALFFASTVLGSVMAVNAQNASALLDVNEVRSRIHPKNSLFWDGQQFPDYEVPAGSGKHSMYLGNIALLGKDGNDLLHGFYNRYNFLTADTLPGPLTLNLATTTPAIAAKYKRVWKINQWEIDLLTQAQANGQLASGVYVAPPDIEEWPANPPAAGYGSRLAPFHDANNDGVYDINDGDYPVIKGEQMLYFILNDRGTTYSTGSDVPLQTGLEIHVSVYGCKKEGATDSTDIINYTTFLEYEIHNRGTISLSDVYLGFNTDADIGYAMDDYAGTHVDANAIYFVNGDAIDGPGSTPGPGQYGADFPAQSIQLLQAPGSSGTQTLGASMRYANSAGATSSQGFYNMLRGDWANGAYQVYGGMGYPGSAGATSIQAKYMYPGDSDPAFIGTAGLDPGFAWTMKTPCPSCPPDSPSDQRGIASTHGFSLLPGDSVRLVLGLITTFLPDSSADARVALNRKQNKQLKQWYDNGDLPCVMSAAPLSNPDAVTVPLSVYPNPAVDAVRISGTAVHAGTAYELVDIHGRKLATGKSMQEGILDVSVRDLSSGIYFIRLHGNGQIQTVKLIKQ